MATAPRRPGWLNRSSAGVALASLFSDVSHELATAVLPMLLLGLGAGSGALGIIEGASDGLSALAKLWGGAYADRAPRRKPLAAAGYLVTAVGMAAMGLCTQAWEILLCRVAAWLGRGSRSASRDILLIENVPAQSLGKAFGMERAGDALGAVIGPMLALGWVASGAPARSIVLGSLVPGLLAFGAITWLVHEPRRGPLPGPHRTLRASVTGTGRAFHTYLAGIAAFGCGDFSRTLLILYATQHLAGGAFGLSGASLAIGLYVLHNAVSAVAAFPLGALTDRVGRKPVLVAGYAFAAAVTLAFALLPATPHALALLFMGSGVAVACEEVAEKALAVVLLPASVKGTGLGVLAAVNGLGDLVSSALVGGLWALFPLRPAVGFAVAAALQLTGAALMGAVPERARHVPGTN